MNCGINDFADRTEEELRAVKAGMPRPSTADASDASAAAASAAATAKSGSRRKIPHQRAGWRYRQPVKNREDVVSL